METSRDQGPSTRTQNRNAAPLGARRQTEAGCSEGGMVLIGGLPRTGLLAVGCSPTVPGKLVTETGAWKCVLTNCMRKRLPWVPSRDGHCRTVDASKASSAFTLECRSPHASTTDVTPK